MKWARVIVVKDDGTGSAVFEVGPGGGLRIVEGDGTDPEVAQALGDILPALADHATKHGGEGRIYTASKTRKS